MKYKEWDIVYVKPHQEIKKIIRESGMEWPGRNDNMNKMTWTYRRIEYITSRRFYKIYDDNWEPRNFMEEWLGESFTPLFI